MKIMTEPPEPTLADPTNERLTRHDDALRWHYRLRIERPPAEFSPHIRTLVYTAAVLGLVLVVGVFWWVIIHVWRIP